jgi:hypothetical protein
MFHFPRLPIRTYVFSADRRRITDARFTYSETRGSKAVQRLPAAYRSRPRPLSAPNAKASTVRPYYLDGERFIRLLWPTVQFSRTARTRLRSPSKLNSMLTH